MFGETDRYIEPNEIVERQCLMHSHVFPLLGTGSSLKSSQALDIRGERRLLSISLLLRIMKSDNRFGLEEQRMKLSDYPPGFSAKRYRATPEQIERNIRESQIQQEKDERHRRKLIEEGKIRPEPHEKPG